MPRSDYDEPLRITQVVGRVGRDPEARDTRAGTVVNFSIAQQRSYGDRNDPDDRGETRWYRVSVWREDLQDYVLDNIQKGAACVVEGTSSKDDYKGETQYSISAFKVGLVEWNTPGRKPRQPVEDDEEDL